MRPEPVDIVNKLRMYAEDLHSAGGFNGYASAMSLAADEIVKLREYARTIEEDLVATIDQRDELGAVLDAARARAWKDRNTRCGCDHNESCAECFPPEFHTGGYWDQQRDDIIRMAREAWFPEGLLTDNMVFLLERFAAVEREACARLCEEHKALRLSEIIRARGDAE